MAFLRKPPSAAPPQMAQKAPITINPAHVGMLHQDLNVPPSQPIPPAKLSQAVASPSPQVRKRAIFAQNAQKFGK